jgi:hypothetical protein
MREERETFLHILKKNQSIKDCLLNFIDTIINNQDEFKNNSSNEDN